MDGSNSKRHIEDEIGEFDYAKVEDDQTAKAAKKINK